MSTPEKKPKQKTNIWYKQQELILKKWGEIGSSYRYLHDRSYIKYNEKNMRFALPVIVISTITGTANFAQGTFPESAQPYVPLFIGLFNLSAGLITTIAQFLRVSELLEGHRAASIAYSKFSRNIAVELSLPIKERTCSGREFINSCRAELDRLIEQSPNIPMDIVKQFAAKFNDKTFIKPDILDIRAVEIYEDKEDAEAVARKAQIEKAAHEKQIADMIMAKEQAIRADQKSQMIEIIERVDRANKQREDKFIKTLEEKTQQTGITDVNQHMDSLLSNLKRNTQSIDDQLEAATDVDADPNVDEMIDVVVEGSDDDVEGDGRVDVVVEGNDDVEGDGGDGGDGGGSLTT